MKCAQCVVIWNNWLVEKTWSVLHRFSRQLIKSKAIIKSWQTIGLVWTIIIHNFCCSHSLIQISQIEFRFTKIEKTLRRIKSGVLPKNPKNVKEILAAFGIKDFLENFGYAYDKEGEKHAFFDGAVDTGKFSYCVFSSKKNYTVDKRAAQRENVGHFDGCNFSDLPIWAVQTIAHHLCACASSSEYFNH